MQVSFWRRNGDVLLVGLVVACAGAIFTIALAVIIQDPVNRWRERKSAQSRAIPKPTRPQQAPILDEELDEKLVNLFVNQETALVAVEAVLHEPSRAKKVTVVTGPAGSGKSWILRYVRHGARSRGHLVCLVDAAYAPTPIDVLLALQRDLNRGGLSVPTFDSALARYRDFRERAAGQTLTTIGANSTDLSSPTALMTLTRQDEFQTSLKSRFRRDELESFLDPEPLLTVSLLEDLKHMDPATRLILLLDSYDRPASLDRWLFNLVLNLPREASLVIASQRGLSVQWQDLRPVTTTLTLAAFERMTAERCLRQYLDAYGADLPAEQQTRILDFAQGSPLAISWAVDIMVRDRTTDFRAVKARVLETLAASMLRVVPDDIRQALESCCIPRWLNQDLVGSLMAPENAEYLYSRISALPFVRDVGADTGIAIHERARQALGAKLRERSPQTFVDLHRKCARYHQALLATRAGAGGTADRGYRNSAIELVFHSFTAEGAECLDIVSQLIQEGFNSSDLEFCSLVLGELDHHDLPNFVRTWADLWSGQLSYRKGDWTQALHYLDRVTSTQERGHPAVPLACITRGRIAYARGEISDAAVYYERALTSLSAAEPREGQGYILEQLAKVRRMEGKLEEGLLLHARALTLSERLGNVYAMSSGLGSYGTTAILCGQLTRGVELLTRGIDLSRASGYREFIITGLRSRASGFLLLGRLVEAEQDAIESYELADRLGDVYNRAVAALYLGEVLITEERGLTRALRLLESAVADLAEVGARFDLGNALAALGACHLTLGSLDQSEKFLSKAEAVFDETGNAYGLAWVGLRRAKLLSSQQKWGRAVDLAKKSRERAKQIGAEYVGAACLLEEARAETALEHYERGIGIVASLVSLSGFEPYWDLQAYGLLLNAEVDLRTEATSRQIVDRGVLSLQAAARHSVIAFRAVAKSLGHLLQGNTELGVAIAVEWRATGIDGLTGIQVEENLGKSIPGMEFERLETLLKPSATS